MNDNQLRSAAHTELFADPLRWGTASCPHVVRAPTVIAMVGLPARGKTYIAKKLTRYLNWIGITTRAFNVGEYRRAATNSYKNHNFFRADNKEAQELRTKCALMAVDDACKFLGSGGEVAFKLFFVESVCDDPKIIEANILEVKVCSPDYVGTDKNEAVKDFLQRIEHYRQTYETMDSETERDMSYIQIFNQGERFIVNKLAVFLGEESRISRRETPDEQPGSQEKLYAEALGKFVEEENIPELKVWTSELKRTIQTSRFIQAPKEHWKALNEIDAGVCEGMTYEEIQHKYPEEFALRDQDKFHYRYPSGEELERQENVMVICHQAVARCLLAYFQDKSAPAN
nr:hypothetical protein BaRGS_031897 [Batillaria attramentaria]